MVVRGVRNRGVDAGQRSTPRQHIRQHGDAKRRETGSISRDDEHFVRHRRESVTDDRQHRLAAVERRGFRIADGHGALAGATFRIGHMGDVTVGETDALLAALDEALVELG